VWAHWSRGESTTTLRAVDPAWSSPVDELCRVWCAASAPQASGRPGSGASMSALRLSRRIKAARARYALARRRLPVRRSPAGWLQHVRRDSLLRNSLYIMTTTIVNSAFGYLFWLILARAYSAANVGLAAAVVAAGTIIAILACTGVGSTLVQSLPRQKSSTDWSRTFWTGAATASATSVLMVCVVLVVLPAVSTEFRVLDGPAYIAIFALGAVTSALGTVLDYAYVAERAAANMLARNSVVAGGKVLIIALAALTLARTVLPILDAWALSATLGVLTGAWLLLRRARLLRPPNAVVLTRLGRELLSGFVGNQLIGLGGGIPPLLLPLLVTARLSAQDDAYFYATWMMCGVLLIISPAVATSLFAEGVHSPRELRAKAVSALGILVGLLIPAMIGFFLLGGLLLSTFGTEYARHATGLLQLIVLSAVPDAITNIYVSALRVQHRLARAARLNLGMGLGTLVVSWLLLPGLGIVAVGWAWLGMQVAGCVYVAVDFIRQRDHVGHPRINPGSV
jgi:O-antigen/teichoic acid export membrane protein